MQGIEENCYASAFLQAVSFTFAKFGGLHMWAIFIGQELGSMIPSKRRVSRMRPGDARGANQSPTHLARAHYVRIRVRV